MSPEPAPSPLVAVAFCPHPPALLPALGGTADAATAALRSACDEALQTVLAAGPDVVLVVGEGPSGVRYGVGDSADLRPWGGEGRLPFAGRVRPGGRPLPLAHAVGAGLLERAGHVGTRLGIAPDDVAAALSDLPGPVVVLAVGGPTAGSATATARALAEGDPVALAGPDPGEGTTAGTGGSSWQAVARVLTGRPVTARLLLDTTLPDTTHLGTTPLDTTPLNTTPSGTGHLVADWVVAPVPDRVPGWLSR